MIFHNFINKTLMYSKKLVRQVKQIKVVLLKAVNHHHLDIIEGDKVGKNILNFLLSNNKKYKNKKREKLLRAQ